MTFHMQDMADGGRGWKVRGVVVVIGGVPARGCIRHKVMRPSDKSDGVVITWLDRRFV